MVSVEAVVSSLSPSSSGRSVETSLSLSHSLCVCVCVCVFREMAFSAGEVSH